MPISSLRGARREPTEDEDFPSTSALDRRAHLRDTRVAPRQPRLRLAPAPEARRPLLVAGGVLIVVVCAAIGADLATRVDHRQPYLVIAHYVPQGSVIEPSDLATAEMAVSDGVAAIPASDSAQVLGRRASEALAPASLLVPTDLTTQLDVPSGDALVGTSLDSDQAPAELAVGDEVIIVVSDGSGSLGTGDSTTSGASSPPLPASPAGTPAATTSPASPTSTASTTGGARKLALPSGAVAAGIVYSIALPSVDASTGSATGELVTLEVPLSAAPAITAASAAGDVSIAEVPAGSGESEPNGKGASTGVVGK